MYQQDEKIKGYYDQAVKTAQALNRPFTEREVMQPAWNDGYEFVIHEDPRFVIFREGDGVNMPLWVLSEWQSRVIKVTIMQITDHYYSLAMIQGQRTWMAGAYGKMRTAKAALTRLTGRGGNEYQAVSFDEYQDAVRAIEA